MVDGKPIFNYQGHEVVFSYTAECPKEFSAKSMKYHPVFDKLESKADAVQMLQKIRKDVEKTWKGQYFEYSSYILKISPNEYKLTYKCYIIL